MTELFKGLEKARQEFNNWQGQARISINFDDMTAWCDVHEIPDYHSDNIVRLVGKDDLHGRNDKYGKEKLERLAQAKLEKFKQGFSKDELGDDYIFAEYL